MYLFHYKKLKCSVITINTSIPPKYRNLCYRYPSKHSFYSLNPWSWNWIRSRKIVIADGTISTIWFIHKSTKRVETYQHMYRSPGHDPRHTEEVLHPHSRQDDKMEERLVGKCKNHLLHQLLHTTVPEFNLISLNKIYSLFSFWIYCRITNICHMFYD